MSFIHMTQLNRTNYFSITSLSVCAELPQDSIIKQHLRYPIEGILICFPSQLHHYSSDHFDVHLAGACAVIASWLEDGHLNLVDIVDISEYFQST